MAPLIRLCRQDEVFLKLKPKSQQVYGVVPATLELRAALAEQRANSVQIWLFSVGFRRR